MSINDQKESMVEIKINDDFDLKKIAESGQCFRWERKNDNTYRVINGANCVSISMIEEGRFLLSCDEDEYHHIWHNYFDLDEDYRSIRRRINKNDDAFLYNACEYGKGIRILRQDPWETLISFIISQNKNIPAIIKSISMLCEKAGKKVIDSSDKPYYIFPSPEEILSLDEEDLIECKLGYRCKYVRAASDDIVNGRISLDTLKESNEEVTMEKLTSIFGVGAKVASCISLFGLHHIDAFPVDVWIRRILDNEYPNGYPMKKYSPYNGIYQQYMFYYYREKQ